MERNICNHTGIFADEDRSKMFIPWQTFEGLQITSYATVEAAKFLISEGMEYILTERFC